MINAQICREEFSEYERLKVVLEDWANWNRGYRMNIGYRSRSVGLQSGYVSADFDDMLSGVEHEMCRMIDCVVSDLPPLHKAAIYRCYGISAVFRFPRENYAEILLDAHDILLVLLPKKGVSF